MKQRTLHCARCNQNKREDCFGYNKSAVARGGRARWCLECWRKYRETHGDAIPQETIEHFMELQGGVCAICLQPERGTGGMHGTAPRRLALDHDSKGKPRGLLCSNCNKVLGHFKDDLARLERTRQYIAGELSWTTRPLEKR